ncbi:RNA polymerase subunit sigma-70 [Pseudonocardia cypriaca]|uniref:RNA polymerase sigma-70 factor (ECF subfamily) n=1 Tax=Pseudonocardia cypriaca TaxID=882449 RepID=A0A543GIK2_9PSEU|nr:RNA polymerase subunit sigma-70 [Pseudonocardia cypriaca]TQM45913.1 RNA polymerase sigma-70 factor (ECF subfamily) [Pseudonocardia cypriaca]
MTVATEISRAVTTVRSGDQAAFAALAEPHRRELQVHCYRMLGSFTDAEDMVQETLLRAWRRRETYAGRSTFRAWLYRIATNTCLDHLERHPRRPRGDGGVGEVTWLQPFPDNLLEMAAPPDAEPDAAVVARETIELAFLVAVQHLPPRQRAVLMLRDVLGWSAAESAAVLESSVASVNSALQRARATLREHLPRRRSEWSPAGPSEEERSVLQRFMEACERADMTALAALLREDAVFSMPPHPDVTRGRDAIVELWAPALAGPSALGELLMVPVRVNRQPAAASYVRRPGEPVFRALALDVLRVEGGVITDVVSFEHTAAFPAFDLLGLPASR